MKIFVITPVKTFGSSCLQYSMNKVNEIQKIKKIIFLTIFVRPPRSHFVIRYKIISFEQIYKI